MLFRLPYLPCYLFNLIFLSKTESISRLITKIFANRLNCFLSMLLKSTQFFLLTVSNSSIFVCYFFDCKVLLQSTLNVLWTTLQQRCNLKRRDIWKKTFWIRILNYKNIILFSKSRIKFKEETNISVRYYEEFVKSRIHQTVVLHESFYCQKWSDREIVFDVKRNSLEFCYAFDLFTYSW